jgi:hypothetical protein
MDNHDRDQKDEQCTLDDPLCLKGEDIRPDGTERVRASNDEASVRRRRARAGLGPDGDDRTTNGMGDLDTDPFGATGIDMGGAGQGTNLKDTTRD